MKHDPGCSARAGGVRFHRKLRLRLGARAVCAGALLAVPGCLDLSPFHVDNDALLGVGGSSAGGATGAADGSVGDGAGPPPSECRSCYLAVPKCVDALAECDRTPRCGPLIQCLHEHGCFEGGPGQAANLCALPCVLQVGISTPTDPAITNATVLTNCSEQSCPGICFPSP